ncbi:MAG TPA: acyltransferase [Bacteroidales bacterium]|mgnify:CR=1 FL=1|nr:acyltransferase [Bacteroidales bacterium]HPS17091.1 acyltransferase [Bacteroidales bacterium]
MIYEDSKKNIKIVADKIEIGKNVNFGNNISIALKGLFSVGDFSHFGNDINIRGNNVKIGKHLFHSSGLRIGGGGRQHPNANLTIGDRCVIHNNFINVCEPVVIGNDVGLSPETSFLTHGYWMSVLEGYPASFAGVKIGNGVIIGYRSLIMMGVEIADYSVIGAQSVVTKSITRKGIYAGSPAKFIKEIIPLSLEQKVEKLKQIIDSYIPIAHYHNIKPNIKIEYPFVFINDFKFNAETFEYWGEESVETDDLRDYIRKWGIRIFTERPFVSNFSL